LRKNASTQSIINKPINTITITQSSIKVKHQSINHQTKQTNFNLNKTNKVQAQDYILPLIVGDFNAHGAHGCLFVFVFVWCVGMFVIVI
jgi:hypothetical protein